MRLIRRDALWALLGVVVAALTACGSAVPQQASSAPVPSASAPPVAPDPPSVGSALPYRADWSAGPAGWTASEGWTVAGGQLHSDGQSYDETAGMVAPLDLSSVGDYAVEAEIQLLRYSDEGMISGLASFGVVTRVQDDGSGYTAGPCVSSGIFSCATDQPGQRVVGLWADEGRTTLDVRPFRPASDWHQYRVEVRGNTLTVLVDGNLALSATDNTYLSGKRVGVWSKRCQISVRSFEVTAL